MMKELVLVIGGSDSSGGAGIQADIKSITVHGAYAASAITSITSQNTQGVQEIFDLPTGLIVSQIDSVMSDLDIKVIKIGMLNNIDLIRFISRELKTKQLVIDPVMVATSGDVLVSEEVIGIMKDVLFQNAEIITPNLAEAEVLSGVNAAFKGAVDPGLDSFSQLPAWLEKKIKSGEQPRVAMFCTGGIRCEKSTAFLKQAGVKEVYHLEGGILKYLEEVPEDESLWEGECFVFDQRVAVGHGLKLTDYELCRACRFPLRPSEKQSKYFQEGVSCSRCYEQTSGDQKARFAERQKQFELAKSRRESFKHAK